MAYAYIAGSRRGMSMPRNTEAAPTNAQNRDGFMDAARLRLEEAAELPSHLIVKQPQRSSNNETDTYVSEG
jgi:hypothetical protein